MFYLLLLLFAAAIFGLCFLADKLLKKAFPKPEGKQVKPPRRGVVFGVVLAFLGLAVAFGFWSKADWPFRICCFAVSAMGVFLLLQYFSFSLVYDESGFYYREKLGKSRHYTYEEILSQRSFLTRSGVNTTLYLESGEVHLYEALDGIRDFLTTAFYAWCEIKSIKPESIKNNPEMLTYFPEPEDAPKS